MPKNALVTLRYGPYRSCGVAEYRTFRLEGLQGPKEQGLYAHVQRIKGKLPYPAIYYSRCVGNFFHQLINSVIPCPTARGVEIQLEYKTVIKEDGHQIILEEIPDWNDVQLIVNGETVFQCNINDLDFGGDGKLDPLCQEAREAVLKAY